MTIEKESITILFKNYYLEWLYEHKLNSKCKSIYDINALKEEIKKCSDIKCILNKFDLFNYLDIWIDICDKEPEFFIDKINKKKDIIIDEVVNEMFYKNQTTIKEFIEDQDNEFIEFDRREVTKLRGIKILLLMAGKLDKVLCREICSNIVTKLTHKLQNINEIKDLWLGIKVYDNGKIIIPDDTYNKFNLFLLKHPDYQDVYKSEIIELFDLLELSNKEENKINRELLFK